MERGEWQTPRLKASAFATDGTPIDVEAAPMADAFEAQEIGIVRVLLSGQVDHLYEHGMYRLAFNNVRAPLAARLPPLEPAAAQVALQSLLRCPSHPHRATVHVLLALADRGWGTWGMLAGMLRIVPEYDEAYLGLLADAGNQKSGVSIVQRAFADGRLTTADVAFGGAQAWVDGGMKEGRLPFHLSCVACECPPTATANTLTDIAAAAAAAAAATAATATATAKATATAIAAAAAKAASCRCSHSHSCSC